MSFRARRHAKAGPGAGRAAAPDRQPVQSAVRCMTCASPRSFGMSVSPRDGRRRTDARLLTQPPSLGTHRGVPALLAYEGSHPDRIVGGGPDVGWCGRPVRQAVRSATPASGFTVTPHLHLRNALITPCRPSRFVVRYRPVSTGLSAIPSKRVDEGNRTDRALLTHRRLARSRRLRVEGEMEVRTYGRSVNLPAPGCSSIPPPPKAPSSAGCSEVSRTCTALRFPLQRPDPRGPAWA